MNVSFINLKKNYRNIKEEINLNIQEVLNSTDYINGSFVNEFESNFSKYLGVKYCLGVGNGTDALEIAIKSLNIPVGSEIITQNNTFISTVIAILNNKCKVRLVDIFEDNFMMNYKQIEEKINKNTKVIIPVHMYGHSANMIEILKIAKKYNLYVIEDCAQAHGCYYNNNKVGYYGDIGCFSFYPGKNLGAYGDGGAIVTNCNDIYEKIKLIKNLGSKKKYEHELVGRNSRLDTIQAAVLNVKLKYLDKNNEKRRKIASKYFELLKDIKQVQLPKIEKYCIPVFHLFVIKIKERNKLKEYLKTNGIDSLIHYPYSINNTECTKEFIIDNNLDISENNAKEILSLPIYPELTDEEITYICLKIINFYS